MSIFSKMNKKKIYICQWRIRFIKITLALCFVFLLFEAEGQRTAANMNLKGNVRRLYTYTHFATEIVVDKE
jgi:hypothetical protein